MVFLLHDKVMMDDAFSFIHFLYYIHTNTSSYYNIFIFLILSQVMEDLNIIGHEYIKINNEIKQHNDELKQKREKKKQLQDKILSIMADKNISELPLSNGTIFLDKKEKKEALNKKNIVNSLKDFCKGDSIEADRIANIVLSNLPKKKISKIRIDS
jgi:hypothetical protein